MSHSEKVASGIELREQFLERIGKQQQFHCLFDNIPGIFFFAKDAQSRMIFASAPMLDRLGTKEDEYVGTTDYDFFPKHVADGFVRDDQRVMKSGKPLLDRLEVWYGDNRMLDWFMTQKHPVRDPDGQIIGVMGTVQSYEGSKKAMVSHNAVSEVVDFIHEHYHEKVKVSDLAKMAGISSRQLQRRFMEVFGVGVKDFLTKTRIQAACNSLLYTDDSITNIAINLGFSDQSAFTQQFRKHVQTTPAAFRRQNRHRATQTPR